MVAFKRFMLLPFLTTLGLSIGIGSPTSAADDSSPCKLAIKGHSIVQLTLIEKSGRSGVRLDKPGETVELPPGEYRVEQVVLEGGFSLTTVTQDWFRVTPHGPNELVVGAPLYPTVTARRHGGFIQMDYKTVDAAGRTYQKVGQNSNGMPAPPTFVVYKDGEKIGSGSFEYG